MKQTFFKNVKIYFALSFILSFFINQGYCLPIANESCLKINGKKSNCNGTTSLILCDNKLVLEATITQPGGFIKTDQPINIYLIKNGVNISSSVFMSQSIQGVLNDVMIISITIPASNSQYGNGDYSITGNYYYDNETHEYANFYSNHVSVNITNPDWQHKILNPSDPATISSSIATNDNFLMFYKDNTNKISCTYMNGSSYDTRQLVPTQTALVDGFLTAKRNANVVYFKGTDAKIHAVYFDNGLGKWNEKLLANQPADVSGYLATNDGNNVYYKDINGKISCVYLDNNTGWTYRGPLAPSQPTDVAGDVVTKKTGNDIYYRSTNGTLNCVTYSNGWVYRGQLAANQPAGDIDILAGISTNNNNNIYFKGATDSRIHCVYFDNSLGKWNWKILVPDQPQNVAGEVVTNDGLTVYYRTTDNRVNCVYFDAGLGKWAHKDPDPNAPSNVGGDLAIRTNSFDCYYRGLDNKMYAVYLGVCPPNLSKVASSEPVSVTSNNSTESSLAINCYPVPFSDNFTFEYNLLNAGSVEIEIYNSMGKMVKRIEDTGQAGNNEVEIEGKELESGFYSINLKANGKMIASKKITKIK